MRISIQAKTATLVGADDFRRFSVDAHGGTLADVTDALCAAGAGVVEGEHAFVWPRWLRSFRQDSDDPQAWSHSLEEMIAYAGSRGWVSIEGGVRAHIENVAGASPD